MSAGDPAPPNTAAAPPGAGTDDGSERPKADDPLVQLGTCLLQARRARGLDRTTLAAQLHMGVEQLEALETADRSRLPELVFVVAQARRIASSLGLDVATLLEPLRALEAPQRAAPRPLPGAGNARSRQAPGRRLRDQPPPARRRAAQGRGAGLRPQALALLTASALVAALVATGWWSLRRAGDSPANPQVQTGTTGEPNRPAPTASGTPGGATPAGSSSMQLVLRSAEPSWLAVRSVDGTTLFEGTVQGERSFPLGPGLEVRAGRPDLVTARVGAGPARVLGPIEQIRWWSFRPAGPAAPAPRP
jgi:cytoskeletal protein RodZ